MHTDAALAGRGAVGRGGAGPWRQCKITRRRAAARRRAGGAHRRRPPAAALRSRWRGGRRAALTVARRTPAQWRGPLARWLSLQTRPALAAAGKSVEEMYQKKTQLEHILLRPDTYIGSTERITERMWVFDPGQGMVQRECEYVPGLYKIFDEILVNAADNKQRDPNMDTIKVEIDVDSGVISVLNNGTAVPVQMHTTENVYVPELIFGHLLTGSNFDDDEMKVTGGRNGFGAKLANIFSTEFVVETEDCQRGKHYKQIFRENMGEKEPPAISTVKKHKNTRRDWTKITFKPDLARFGMDSLDSDAVALMTKRVYDMAGSTLGIQVYLNGEKLPIKNFLDYVNLFVQPEGEGEDEKPMPLLYQKFGERWEVAVSLSDGQFSQVSFVNSIATIRGGTHVNHVTDQLAKHLSDHVNKTKRVSVKPFQVKQHIWVFVNCLIENPAFDSQTKCTLTSKAESFGTRCDLDKKFLAKVVKCGVVDNIMAWSRMKDVSAMRRQDGVKQTKVVLPKLDDANLAGGPLGKECTLILTEGDSAKALAVSGLGVVGRDKFGVFPLRGKLLNVRQASQKQVMNNAEITAIKKILGLQTGKHYHDTDSLRYGRVMIMADQDHDGSHIKGLFINFIHSLWPSLLQVPGFMQEFITPIVKATKGQNTMSFFSIPEYLAWKEENENVKNWSIKYYKGLGTSTSKEAKEYFGAMDFHRKDFVYSGIEEDELLDMAFSKKKADQRKEWLAKAADEPTRIDHTTDKVSYGDFINKELVQFSMADNIRSIPSAVDGLKPSQRKVLFCCFKRQLTKEIKVAQLAGYVSEHSAYHHGEASLHGTIVNMAQDHCGSNNVNLLVPSGQFGTRLLGGKDAASPRYIFTRLDPLARCIFHEDDEMLLNYLDDDGLSIEPTYYMPIVPLVLINGSEGIGTGWSTSIPNYNPNDVIANINRLLDGEDMQAMSPWYRDFHGSIHPMPLNENRFHVRGCVEKLNTTTLRITELPIGVWTNTYTTTLTQYADDKMIESFTNVSTDTGVCFEVKVTRKVMQHAEEIGLEKYFKLESFLSTSE